MASIYPEKIQLIAKDLIESIEKHYPGTTKKNFDNFGLPHPEGNPAQIRAEMCIYVELLKSGVLGKNEPLYKCETCQNHGDYYVHGVIDKPLLIKCKCQKGKDNAASD